MRNDNRKEKQDKMPIKAECSIFYRSLSQDKAELRNMPFYDVQGFMGQM